MTGHEGQSEIDERFRRYRANPRRRLRNELVEDHIGFARHVARRYAGRGVADDDLHQIALLALVKAIERFDPDYGAAFTTFAGRTIEGEIKRHFRDAGWAMRVPRSMKERHLQVRAAGDRLSAELGRPPTVAEVAADLDISRDEVVEALAASAAYSPSSLDAGTSDADDDPRPSAWLAQVDTNLRGSDDRVLVERLIAGLPEREQTIVTLRFFGELSQSEIAERVGVSQMHVSRLLRRSFDAMRLASGEPDG